MYTDITLKIVNDTDPYVDINGTQYPWNFPKNEISTLFSVTTTDQPTDPTVNITGFVIQNINDAYTQVWQTSPKVLSTVQTSQINILDNACSATIVGGFTSSALGTAYNYPSTPTDQMNLSASVIASMLPNLAQDWSTPFWCVDSNNVWALRNHTIAQIQQVGSDAKTFVQTQIVKNANLAAQVIAATTVAQVQAITW